jgi:hypothetical protein
MEALLDRFLAGEKLPLGQMRQLDTWLTLQIAGMQCRLDPDTATYSRMYAAWMDVLRWYDKHPEEVD